METGTTGMAMGTTTGKEMAKGMEKVAGMATGTADPAVLGPFHVGVVIALTT
jgi:hypothetical protein